MVRLVSFIVAGAVIAAGLAVYADPPADPGDDPPILKKKGAPDIEAPAPKPDDDKDKDKPKDQDKDKKPADAPKPGADDAQPVQPQQDPDEVLNRASKDMRRAEDRLANKELDDATRQAQDDALKDLDLLIDLNENPPPDGGGQDNDAQSDPSKSGGQKSGASKSGSGSSGSSSGSSGSKGKGRGKGKQKGGKGNGQGGSRPGAGGMSGDKQPSGGDPNSKSPNGGNGGGGKNSPTLKDPNADLYKDVWGHLPETLRAEMNAYANTRGFMPEYEALISKYYSTIAEQGRRKGD